jgi:hypothetical protein
MHSVECDKNMQITAGSLWASDFETVLILDVHLHKQVVKVLYLSSGRVYTWKETIIVTYFATYFKELI